jgi:phosphopantetheinyl transferase (holo-ACP synthase)
MKGFVAVTNNDWFAFLSQQPGIDEVHFATISATVKKVKQPFKERIATRKEVKNARDYQ